MAKFTSLLNIPDISKTFLLLLVEKNDVFERRVDDSTVVRHF